MIYLSNDKIRDAIKQTVSLYMSYGITLKFMLARLEISRRQYYYLSADKEFSSHYKPLRSYTKITQKEELKVIAYAKKHTELFHRELAYRMLDENVTALSESTVYRILKVNKLILGHTMKKSYGWIHKYSNEASAPDELWQTDLTYLRYQNRDVYQLSFIDVFSRYIVLSVTLLNMTSSTVSDVFEKYIEHNKNSLKRIPIIQSDNGSPYIGKEFQQVMRKFNFTHNRIHPGVPTENVIIERWHRTFKEELEQLSEPKIFSELVDKTNQVCYYYNHVKYHSSLGFVPPYVFYRGNPEKIFEERKIKLAKAKKLRIQVNKAMKDSQ